MTFCDNHGHLGEHASHYHLPNCTLDEIVRDLDRFGIAKSCVFGFTGVFSERVRVDPGQDSNIEDITVQMD